MASDFFVHFLTTYLPTMSDDFYSITSNIWGIFWTLLPTQTLDVIYGCSLTRNKLCRPYNAGGGFMANQQRTIFTLMWRNVFPINATFRSCVKQRIHISVCKSVGFCASSILASFVSFCKEVFRNGRNTLFCLLQLDENNSWGPP